MWALRGRMTLSTRTTLALTILMAATIAMSCCPGSSMSVYTMGRNSVSGEGLTRKEDRITQFARSSGSELGGPLATAGRPTWTARPLTDERFGARSYESRGVQLRGETHRVFMMCEIH